MLQLSSIGVPNEEQHRRTLRQLLFEAPGVENYISGVVRKASWRCILTAAFPLMCIVIGL